MKKLIPFLTVLALITSCKKDEFPTIDFPEAPKSIEVTYSVSSKEINAPTLKREITYLSGWHMENEKMVPEYTTVTVTGDFKTTVMINTIAVPVGKDSPGRTYRKVPIGAGWERADGTNSVTAIEISSPILTKTLRYAGGCPTHGRPLFNSELWLPDMY